jgi:hypothetical protein
MPIEEQFAGLNPEQVRSGKKHMLYAQMEVLTAIQKYERYKQFRKEEFAVKHLLKKVMGEVQKEMETLSLYLPQIKVHETSAVVVTKVAPPKDKLQAEIEDLRRKIAALQI